MHLTNCNGAATLMTIQLPTGPGLPWTEPSVNITIVWSVTGSRIF